MKQRILINTLRQKVSYEISNILTSSEEAKFEVRRKPDKSVVTNIDEKISAIVKNEMKNIFGDKYKFYCEEDHDQLNYPAIILDPIDGTKGLVTGTYECSVSLAIMETSDLSKGYGWIFNPFTGFSIASDDVTLDLTSRQVGYPIGLVSRSEWDKGTFKDIKLDDIILAPVGSIAFKLGLLAAGACHFIISAHPKNIWDIAAGSILCQQRGIFMFNKEGIEVSELNDPYITGPMFWCRKDFTHKILNIIKQKEENEL
jgi:myo-inositol-1(or 4)-monophosphatase